MTTQKFLLSSLLALTALGALPALACDDLSGTYVMADRFQEDRYYGVYSDRCNGPYVMLPNQIYGKPGQIDEGEVVILKSDVDAGGGTYSEYVTLRQEGCKTIEIKQWSLLGGGRVVNDNDITLTKGLKLGIGGITTASWSHDGHKLTVGNRWLPTFLPFCAPPGGCGFGAPGGHYKWTFEKTSRGIAFTYYAHEGHSSKVDVSCEFEAKAP